MAWYIPDMIKDVLEKKTLRILIGCMAGGALCCVCGCADTVLSIPASSLPEHKQPVEFNVKIPNGCTRAVLDIEGYTVGVGMTKGYYAAGLLTLAFFDSNGNYCGCGGLSPTSIRKREEGFFYLPGYPYQSSFDRVIDIPPGSSCVRIALSRSKKLDLRLTGFTCTVRQKSVLMPLMVDGAVWCIRNYRFLIFGVLLMSVCGGILLLKKRIRMTACVKTTVIAILLLTSFAICAFVKFWGVAVILCGVLGIIACLKIPVSDDMVERSLSVVVLIGVILRLMTIVKVGCIPRSDFLFFWNQSSQWASGCFVETKCYPLVALYGLAQWIFGSSYGVVGIVNAVLGGIQIWLVFKVVHRIFLNRFCAMFSAMAVAFNPALIILTPAVASEILYGSLLLVSLFGILNTCDMLSNCVCAKRLVLMTAATGICAMLTMFTRGNGIVLIPVMVVVTAGCGLKAHCISRWLRMCIVPLVLTVGVMLSLMSWLTYATTGKMHVTGNRENVWPVLFGSSIKTNGHYSPYDIKLIMSRFAGKYSGSTISGKGFAYDTTTGVLLNSAGEKFDLVRAKPLIMDEFRRRWREDTRSQVELSLYKFKHLWNSDGIWAYSMCRSDGGILARSALLCTPMHQLRSFMALASIVGLLLLIFLRSESGKSPLECVGAAAAVLLGNVVIHFIVEWQPRYSYVLWLLLPITASSLPWAVRRLVAASGCFRRHKIVVSRVDDFREGQEEVVECKISH